MVLYPKFIYRNSDPAPNPFDDSLDESNPFSANFKDNNNEQLNSHVIQVHIQFSLIAMRGNLPLHKYVRYKYCELCSEHCTMRFIS